jgi:glutamyl-tRNA synthetase
MVTSTQPIRVRFAPSPTGRLHLGGARTALYDYLLARQIGGKFILRIEDIDLKRFVPGAEEELMHGLHWLGLEWDEGPDIGGPYGPYRQSERKEIYIECAQQLISQDKAYYCFCTPEHLANVREQQQKLKLPQKYDGTCRRLDPGEAARRVAAGEPHVIRFKTPEEGSITVHDHLRGDITVENRSIDDYILIRSDGFALYHLAAMVDDHLMDISHVIRGSEWLSTFPLHAHIVRAFGWQEPVWVHLSIFLKPSGKGKMSKRESAELMKDGYSIFVNDLEGLGYVPEAVVNWIALMGWSYDDHTEFFTIKDLIEKFNLERLNPAPAAINFTKFDHFNGLHIRNLATDDLCQRVQPFFTTAGYRVDEKVLLKIIPIIQQRIATLEEAPTMAGFFFEETVNPNPTELVGAKMTVKESAEALRAAHDLLATLPEINIDTAEIPLRVLADQLHLKAGQLFGILRVAVTGKTVSPPLIESMAIIGKEKVLERISNGIKMLEKLS